MAGELAANPTAMICLGICAGILSGTLGVGSGAIVVPALVLLFSFHEKTAQGTALAVMVPMALVGAIRYKLSPDLQMDISSAALIALGAVAGALLGAELAARLPAGALRKIFAIFLMLIAARMFFPGPRQADAVDDASTGGPVSTAVNPGDNPVERD